MVETVLRRSRRRAVERMAAAAAEYAALGWTVCPGAYPPRLQHHGRPLHHRELLRACSCDRVGCPAPGAHPVSPAWQVQATTDAGVVGHWWMTQPRANVILVTGREFDVLDVPADAGTTALGLMQRSEIEPGPVAISTGDRALFFVATRGRPADEGEWWSCHLDCEPEASAEVSGLRWHCRSSYVLAPPSVDGSGQRAHWLLPPDGRPLPDALRLLGCLADACEGSA